MYRLFIQYLQPDNEVSRFVYNVTPQELVGILKAHNKDRAVHVKPVDDNLPGVIVVLPSDRIILLEAIPLDSLKRQAQQEAENSKLLESLSRNSAPPPSQQDTPSEAAVGQSEGA